MSKQQLEDVLLFIFATVFCSLTMLGLLGVGISNATETTYQNREQSCGTK